MTRDNPDALGECEGCGRPFAHDEAIVSADFCFNAHGSLMAMSDADNGLYHHDCLRRELRVPYVPSEVGAVEEPEVDEP